MIFNTSRSFFNRFPGPFDYVAGRDGVDETFDVICLTTEQPVISTYYWHERRRAELVARIVADALNDPLFAFEPDETPPTHRLGLAEFYRHYPGPYATRRRHCDDDRPRFEIICKSNGDCVLFAVASSSSRIAKITSRYVAAALNTIIQHVDAASPELAIA